MAKRSQRQNTPAAAEKPETAEVTDDEMFNISGDQGDDQGDDEPTVPVTLRADAWVPDRQPKGTTLPLPLSRAAKLIDEGKAERADPLPGGSA